MIQHPVNEADLSMRPGCSPFQLLLTAIAIVSGTGRPAQSQILADSAIRTIMQNRVDTRQSTGLVIATTDGGTIRVLTAGSSGAAGVALDGNTVFEIGSITKVFTSALLADMVARGEVKLDDPIAKYLPASVRVPSRGGKQITLLELATQSSGLPRLPGNLAPVNPSNPYADYTVPQLYSFLSSYELTRDIGATYEYSNLGVGLLGHVLALRAGKTYEQLLIERIFEPLRMTDTRIQLTAAMKSRLAQGHDEAGGKAANWDLPTLAGAGALRSTANDMLKFLAANLGSTNTPLERTLATTRVPRRDIPGAPLQIGLGWHILSPFGRPIVWHNGGTGGFRSLIALDQASQRGVVVLSNQSIAPDDIGFHILDQRAPLTPPPKVRAEISVDASILQTYVGVYELAPTFSITITREGQALFAQATGQEKFPLFAESPTEFFYKVVDAQVTFEKDASGKVTRLILHQGGQHIPGAKK